MRFLILFGCLQLGFIFSWGQSITFNHITQADGLRTGNVRTIIQDYQGFMWIGTEDGLHRYDGYNMVVYRNSQSDSTSISSNFILTLFEDAAKNLWVGTLDGGLCLYNRSTDNFRCFKHDPKNQNSLPGNTIRTFCQTSDGTLLIGSNGLSSLASVPAKNVTPVFKRIALPVKSKSNEGIRVISIVKGFDDTLLVSIYNQGVYYYNTTSEEFKEHPITTKEKNVMSLYVDKTRKLLWAGTWSEGLVVYNQATNSIKRFKAGVNENELKSNVQLNSLLADEAGNLWIATGGGLSFFPAMADPFKANAFTTYLSDDNNFSSLHGQDIKSLYIDHQEKLWVGSYYKGVNVYDKNSMSFATMSFTGAVTKQESDKNIAALEKDKHGNLWIGTDGSGLEVMRYAGQNNVTSSVESVPLGVGSASNTKIKVLKTDHDNLWVGTWGDGLVRINPVTKVSEYISARPAFKSVGKEIQCLDVDSSERLWIGTFDTGLFSYDYQKDELQQYRPDDFEPGKVDRINCVLVGHDDVWIGKEAGGLNLLKKGSLSYTVIVNTILNKSTTITSIYEDGDHMLWLGVPIVGLVKYNSATKEVVVYGENTGLGNSVIQSIEEDSKKRLWLSTNLGITVFEKASAKFTNFSKANGLSANQFNRNSSVTLSDGTICMGNVNGINCFNPDTFSETNINAPIVFTRFYLDNVEQRVTHSSVLKENIITLKEIRLDYNQNSFSIEFAALDLRFSDQNEYAYLLEGFDETWQDAKKIRQASYTNLDPGHYTFKVRHRDADSQWSGENADLSLSIIISPAWWQTVWFKSWLLLSIVCVVMIIHYARIRYLLAQQLKLEDLVKERTGALHETNALLKLKIEEINSINTLLHQKHVEVTEMNNEIQAQNEELVSQNEHISTQQDSLIAAQIKLQEINQDLERLVNERTEALQTTVYDLNKTVFELDRFVYSASHDLSAPLKSIRGLVQIIHLENDPNVIKTYAKYINDCTLKLEVVIKNMADYTQNSHREIETEKFNLYELVHDTISRVLDIQTGVVIDIQNTISRDVDVVSDQNRVRSVLRNLIKNGIKFHDSQKESCWVKISYEKSGSGWTIIVQDNGIGIETQYLDKIFNMYFRATEKAKGSGLGLFIVKETVDKLQGDIRVDSSVGKGTTFTIRLSNRDLIDINGVVSI